ncbi:roadblock/LC7 domain-containing protein [Kitasatospora sp. NPDC059571]|uniref:roadblock/LC7 domain-containing protein n=1 Tax=Kitasatospora sp. NPDC059571 TaxID=3346871 RepID=UPI0036AF2DCF
MSSEQGDLVAELCGLRERVVGVTDLAVAAGDGLLIAADTDEEVDSECLAALAAAALGLARRSGQATGKGALHRTVAHFGHGYLVVQPVGEMGLLTVLGDAGLDVERLHTESQAVAERIDRVLTAPDRAPSRT